MNDQHEQLAGYIKHQLAQGVSVETVRQALTQQHWRPERIDQAFAAVGTPPNGQSFPAAAAPNTVPSNKETIKAILWIVSGFVVLFINIFLTVIGRLVIGESAGMVQRILSIITILIGFAGMILLIVGPIVGIIKLVRKK